MLPIPGVAGQGLSPRRRGNQALCERIESDPGSIPAQAGEPIHAYRSDGAIRVYPRAGGGTVSLLGSIGVLMGLSPRRRGNLEGAVLQDRRLGSIPAQAGEPLVANSLNCLQCQRT